MAKITITGPIATEIISGNFGAKNTPYKKFCVTVESGNANTSKKSVFGIMVFGNNEQMKFKKGDYVSLEGEMTIESFQVNEAKPAVDTVVVNVSTIDIVSNIKQQAKARQVLGNLTKDATKITKSSTPFVKTSIAINTKQGNSENISFYNLLVWEKRGDTLLPYLSKGKRILVDGNIRTEYYDKNDNSGKGLNVSISVDDFQFTGGSKKEDSQTPSYGNAPDDYIPQNISESSFDMDTSGIDINSNEIPF